MLDFFTGNSFRAYERFGVHKAAEGFSFTLYAPNALSVTLKGDWNARAGNRMHKDPLGVFSVTVPQAADGDVYSYLVEGCDGVVREKTDPYAFFMEKAPGFGAVICDPFSYSYTDREWMEKRNKNYNRPMHIYELHAGSFKRKADNGFLSFRELADELLVWILKEGYTHVEFLPVMEHPYLGSWGYQQTGFFSPSSRYGHPSDLAYLVNLFHEKGIGVIFDFVGVHFAADSYGLVKFDGSALYEYPDQDISVNEWGSCNFNPYSPCAVSYLKSAADFLARVYHADGLRFDAVSNMIYWMGDANRGVNAGGIELLRELNEGIHKEFPYLMMIAEDSTAYPGVTKPVSYEGLGFDYKWDMGWMHDTLNYFSRPVSERREHYHELTFSMAYFYSELFVLALSHDEVVHGKKTILDRMYGSYEEKFAQSRLLFTYMMTHPGKKLNFIGNEFAQFREWDEKRVQDFELTDFPMHKKHLDYFERLSMLYQNTRCLYQGEYDPRSFSWLVCDDREHLVYAYRRIHKEEQLLVVLNTSDQKYDSYCLNLADVVSLTPLLCSDDPAFGGRTKAVTKTISVKNTKAEISLPAFSALIFSCEVKTEKDREKKRKRK